MLTVTTGGTIAEASDIVDDADIDNQGEAIHKTAATQNNTVIGMQESANITLTIALPVGTASTTAETNAGRDFSSLATDAIAVGTIVNSYIVFLMPQSGGTKDLRSPVVTFQFDPGEKVLNVYDNAVKDIDDTANTAFTQIENADWDYDEEMVGVGGVEIESGKDTVTMTTGTDTVGGTISVGFSASTTGDFVRVITLVQTTLEFSEKTKSMIRSQSITSRAIIRQSINQVQERMEFTRNLKENISQQNIKVGIDVNNNQANNLLNNLSAKTLNPSGRWFDNFALWTGGSVITATVDGTSDILGENIYNNSVVTLGIDKKTKNNNTFGIAATRIQRDTEIGSSTIYIDTVAHNITTYANVTFNGNNSLDVLLGGGELENDIARNLSTSTNTALREGYQVFSSLKYTKNELFNNNNKKFIKSRKSRKNKQTDFNFVKFNLHLIQNEYPRVLKGWDIDFDKVYPYEEYIKLFSKLNKENQYPLLAFLPITEYLYADEDEGYVYVNEDVGSEQLTSINSAKKIKNNLDGSFYSKIDLGFTSLDDYTEKGSTSLLVFNKQYVKSGTLALGTSLSKKHELSDGFIEPFARLELGGNLLHNSANYSYYTNNTEVTTYKVDEEERAHVRAGTGFKANLHNDLEINLSYDYYEEMGSTAVNIDSYEQALNFTIKKYLNKN
jgi:hypothetical protein